MSGLRKAAEQAATDLEELIHWHGIRDSDDKLMPAHNQTPEIKSAIESLEALRQALAQPEQEPVAWMNKKSAFMCGKTDESGVAFHIITTSKQTKHHTVPLYTAPPKREWVGLTKEDMPVGDNPMFDTDEFALGAAWAQAKLKEKNT